MKIRSAALAAILSATALLGAVQAHAAAGNDSSWHSLGSRVVSDAQERDSVFALFDGSVSEIKICVSNRAVQFSDVDVVFGNGNRQGVSVRNRIGAGQCTRAIDLRGDERHIRRVIMDYRTANPFGQQAVVTVLGR